MVLFGENFPYTNFHDLNLDWILRMIKELDIKVDTISATKITVSDPIQWDITRQYPVNTVVIDDGKAYLSMQAVPYGIDIGNEEYWQEIFNVEDVFDSLKHAISVNDDGNSNVSTANRSKGELVWVGDVLKIVTSDIQTGDQYTAENIADITIEELLNSIFTQINGLADDIEDTNTEVSKRIKNRLVGKKIAIYGDSWSNETWGTPWINKLRELSQATVHVSALGSATLAQIYSNCWDQYNADIYIIEGGLNDMALNTGGDTFMSAIVQFVNSIRTINSQAEIYFITPPKIERTDLLHKKFPLEFYRCCIWELANKHKYHVINGLKWVDILFADSVHPTPGTAPVIGEQIYFSLQNHGDEETHVTELSTLGSENTNILFRMIEGIPYLEFQNVTFSNIAYDGSSSISLPLETGITIAQANVFGKPDNLDWQPAMVVVADLGQGTSLIVLMPAIKNEGVQQIRLYQGGSIRLNISQWNIYAT